MPRLFTGVEIPTDVSFDLEIMKGGIIGARWIDRESFHITLRFIGDIDGSLAREIAYELDGVEARPFSLRMKGIDVMGGNKPHTLFAGIEESADCGGCNPFMKDCPGSRLPAERGNLCPRTLARLLEPDLHACTVCVLPQPLSSRSLRVAVCAILLPCQRGAVGPMRLGSYI